MLSLSFKVGERSNSHYLGKAIILFTLYTIPGVFKFWLYLIVCITEPTIDNDGTSCFPE